MKVWLRILAVALCMVLMQGAALAEATFADGGEAENITGDCRFRVSEGDRDKLTDGSLHTSWSYENIGAWVGVKLPDNKTAGYFRIEWLFDPTGFELIEYDADMNVLRTRTLADTFPSICMMFELNAATKYIQVKMTAKDQSICRVRVYSAGELPNSVQYWLPPQEKVDMMVISTHQDDEVIFLGGTIPYSDVVCGRPTITVYMANCTRSRRGEALDCLWAMGSRHYPEFINLKDERLDSFDASVELWGGKENILKEMVERIRRYKPEVIVTQDFNGEYGHNQHKVTARATPYAIEAAADPNQFPESYQKYGAWQVKKLYIHLYGENQIRMDWTSPREELNGYTLLKVAQIGMSKHASQTQYYTVKDGGKYDNALYGLYMTQVGADVKKDDFFENIPEGASAQYLAEHPATAQPVATPAAEEDFETADAGTDAGFDDLTATPIPDDEADAAIGDTAQDADMADAGELPEDDLSASGEPGLTTASEPVVAAPPVTATESRGGGVGMAIAMVAAGVLVAGGGALYLRRLSRSRSHHRRPRR